METGHYAEASMTVLEQDTAKALSQQPEDDFPEVFATSRMLALMELAAARCMKSVLGENELSVGVGVDIKHLAATPKGSTVTAKAIYMGQEGKLYKFKIEAFDEGGQIGRGEHTRAIVTTERLMAGALSRTLGKSI